MHQALDAVCRDGQIVPLEAVTFRENERVVILRLAPVAPDSDAATSPDGGLASFVGVLKGSPNWGADPVAIQQAWRHEWD